ncbi:MAG: serine/threonine-protein kinase [Rubrivivax sp.]
MSEAARALPEFESALPPGTRLAEFEVKGVLGVGGFGIVYLAFDHALEREVAVKEYMPASMAGRTETMHVSLRSQSDAEVFALGLRSFVNEAKLLARFDHPSLIKVHRFWEANGTAYMAMPVLRGRTLKDIRRSTNRAPDEAWLRSTLTPLLGALEQLHNEGVYHRDIAPDNIHLESEGRPVLLDFGAARRVITGKTQTLTAILKPAYAPIEQYGETGSVRQGPWTDLYALGATLHFMLLGHPPLPATARTVAEEASALTPQLAPGISPQMLGIIEWMLAPRPADRPQNVGELRAVLEGRAPLPYRPAAATSGAAAWEKTAMAPQSLLPQGPQPVTVPLVDSAITDIELDMPAPPLAPGARREPDRTSTPPLHRAAHDALPVAADDAHRLPPPVARSKVLPLALAALVVGAGLGAAGWWRFAAPGEGAAAAPAASAAAPSGAAAAGAAAAVPEQGAASGTAAAPTPASPTTSPMPTAATTSAATAAAATPTAATSTAATPIAATPTAAAPTAATPTAAPPTAATPTAPTPVPSTTAPAQATAPQAEAAPPSTPTVPTAARPNRAPPTATPEGAAAERPRLPESPSAACAGRTPVSQDICMERLCALPRFRQLGECQPYRQPARRREGAGG